MIENLREDLQSKLKVGKVDLIKKSDGGYWLTIQQDIKDPHNAVEELDDIIHESVEYEKQMEEYNELEERYYSLEEKYEILRIEMNVLEKFLARK